MKTNKEEFSLIPNPKSLIPKHLCLLLILLTANLAFSQTIWNGTADTTWYTGNKSANEYTITTAEQLAGLANLVNGADGNGNYSMIGKTIKLGKNIVLNDTANWRNWATEKPKNEWTAIGASPSSSFDGAFDGNGHVVSGVYINTVDSYQGLFGLFVSCDCIVSENGAEIIIKNLGVSASYIKGGENVGGIVGFSRGTISNSYYSGIVSGKYDVGGTVGYNHGAIANSYAEGTVSGIGKVGGLAGYSSFGKITNSYATGAVSGTTNVGGLAGNTSHSAIANSYATGTVTGTENVGGLAGMVKGFFEDKKETIANSYATGAVSGNENVGGFVGTIDNCFITNSYAIGAVSGKKNAGGLLGVKNGGKISNGFYDRQTSGRNDTGKGLGKTTANMKLASAFSGWDFKDIWKIDGEINNGYPHLLAMPPKKQISHSTKEAQNENK